jgi:hypothetical protein
MKSKAFIATALVLALGACTRQPSPEEMAASQSAQSESVSSVASEAASKALSEASDPTGYLGKWFGPEGTSLVITQTGPTLSVSITNLDGMRNYIGEITAAGVKFDRDGTPYVIRKGTGKDTGMKWLVDKTDCLIVTGGEGYCRD